MRIAALLIVACALPLAAVAGGFAANEDFVVRTAGENGQLADRAFAEAVAERATEYKQAIAQEWLGQTLPTGIGRTYLTVMVTDETDHGRTWPKNKITGEYHNVHLRTTRAGALGGTLAHEVAHVVLSTRYQASRTLPPWAAEGIASRYDAEDRVAQRREMLQWYVETGNWPDLAPILGFQVIPAGDKASYTVSVSLCEYLLTRGDKKKLLEFASAGASTGWDRALNSTYDIRNVEQLQSLWQAWAAGHSSSENSPSDVH